MLTIKRPLGWLLILAAVSAWGCGSSDQGGVTSPGKDKLTKKDPDGAKPKAKDGSAAEKTKEPEPAKISPIELSEEYAKTCLVKLGDKMPDFSLKDLDGKQHTLSSLLQELTVLVLWNNESSQSRNALVHLSFAAGKAPSGVRYVGINVGDPPDAVKETIAKTKVKLPVLLDNDKALFNKVATDLLPRVYLLDQEGRIVWFNVSFQGPDTSNKLNEAIEYLQTAEKKKGG